MMSRISGKLGVLGVFLAWIMSSCEAFRPLLILFIFGQIIKAMMVTLGIDPQ